MGFLRQQGQTTVTVDGSFDEIFSAVVIVCGLVGTVVEKEILAGYVVVRTPVTLIPARNAATVRVSIRRLEASRTEISLQSDSLDGAIGFGSAGKAIDAIISELARALSGERNGETSSSAEMTLTSPLVKEPSHAKSNGGTGVAAMITGIIGALFVLIPGLGFLGCLISIISLVLASRSRRKARNAGETSGGMATTGLVLGIIGTSIGGLHLLLWTACAVCTGAVKHAASEATSAAYDTVKEKVTEDVKTEIIRASQPSPSPIAEVDGTNYDFAFQNKMGQQAASECKSDSTPRACQTRILTWLANAGDAYKNAPYQRKNTIFQGARGFDSGFFREDVSSWEGTLDSFIPDKKNRLSYARVSLNGPGGFSLKLHASEITRKLVVPKGLVRLECVRFSGQVNPQERSVTEAGAMEEPEHDVSLSSFERCESKPGH